VPAFRASTIACSSTMPARAKLRIVACGFIMARRAALTMPLVASISGTCTVTTSARLKISSTSVTRSTEDDRFHAWAMVMAGS